MSSLNVVTPLPEWVQDTFEGRFLDAWVGCVPHGGDQITISGITDLRQNGFDTILKLHDIDLDDLVSLCEEANTPLANLAAGLLADPESLNAIFTNQDEINLRVFVERAGDIGFGSLHRPIAPEDFLLSLVSRYPDEIPFVETLDDRGAKLITASGIEPFKTSKALRQRTVTLASPNTPSSERPGQEHEYWNKTTIAVEAMEIIANVAKILARQ